jgi:hypothetical protein
MNKNGFLKKPLGPAEEPASWFSKRISAFMDTVEPQFVCKFVLLNPGDMVTLRVGIPFQVSTDGVVQCTMHIESDNTIELPTNGMIKFTECKWHNMYGMTLPFTKTTAPPVPLFETVTPIVDLQEILVSDVTARIEKILERVAEATDSALTTQLQRECVAILARIRNVPYNSKGAYDLSVIETLYAQLVKEEDAKRQLVSSSSDALVLMPPKTMGKCTRCKKSKQLHVNSTCKQCFNDHVMERTKAVLYHNLNADQRQNLQNNVKTVLEQLGSTDQDTIRKGHRLLRACEHAVEDEEHPAPAAALAPSKKRKSMRTVKPVERLNLTERPEDDHDDEDDDGVDLGADEDDNNDDGDEEDNGHRKPMQQSEEEIEEEEEEDDADSWIVPSNGGEDDDDDDDDDNDKDTGTGDIDEGGAELKKLRLADGILKSHKRLCIQSVFADLEDNYVSGDKDALKLVEHQLKQLAKVEQVWCIQVTHPGSAQFDYQTHFLRESDAAEQVSKMITDVGTEKSGIKYKIYQKKV